MLICYSPLQSLFVLWTAGSQELQILCSNHDECEARQAQIKMTKGFVAKEPVKGQMASLFLMCIYVSVSRAYHMQRASSDHRTYIMG